MRNAGGCENAECSLMHVRECEVRNAVAAKMGVYQAVREIGGRMNEQ